MTGVGNCRYFVDSSTVSEEETHNQLKANTLSGSDCGAAGNCSRRNVLRIRVMSRAALRAVESTKTESKTEVPSSGKKGEQFVPIEEGICARCEVG